VPPQELLPGLEQCAWADDAQAFVCPRVARLRTAIAYQYTPFDSAGRAQRRPSPGATAAVRVRVARADTTLIPGGPSTPFGTFAAANEQTLTLSGLRGGALTLDGTMTAAVEGAVTNVQGPGGPGSGPPGAVAVRLRITQVVAGLVLPAGDARWPAAGTLTTELRDAATGATALRQVVTFDGTRTAAVEEVADGAVRRCTFDLDAPSLPTTCAG
jgi:hypothetical protein